LAKANGNLLSFCAKPTSQFSGEFPKLFGESPQSHLRLPQVCLKSVFAESSLSQVSKAMLET
jgi:hypothetical protein